MLKMLFSAFKSISFQHNWKTSWSINNLEFWLQRWLGHSYKFQIYELLDTLGHEVPQTTFSLLTISTTNRKIYLEWGDGPFQVLLPYRISSFQKTTTMCVISACLGHLNNNFQGSVFNRILWWSPDAQIVGPSPHFRAAHKAVIPLKRTT